MIRDNSERQKQAWSAVLEYIQASLVAIVDGPPNEPKFKRHSGSGTLVRTPANKIIVLSADHVLKDVGAGFSLGAEGIKTIGDPFAAIWKHPDATVDVAVALLQPRAAEACGQQAINWQSIAAAGDDWVEGEPAIVCGFPVDYRVERVDEVRKVVTQSYVPVAYTTLVHGTDNAGRYKLAWGDAFARDDDRNPLLPVFDIKPGELFQQKRPTGVSGGPLWRLRPLDTREIWSASRAADIIGICESWDEESIAFCPSTRVWGPWFREVIAQIDAA